MDGQQPHPHSQLAADAHVENMSRLAKVGAVAHEHFTNFQAALNYDYLEGKRVIGVTEAMGIREVASKQVPAGPTSTGT